MSKRIFSIQDEDIVEINSFPFQLPLHALYASRATYANYPPFQREKVWNDLYKFELIDTIVKKGYIPPLIIAARTDGIFGKWVLEGQQRLTTIMQFMEAMEADMAGQPVPKDEEGREYFYFRLTQKQEERLYSYHLRFEELLNVPETLQAETFERLNNQIALTKAERLWSKRSAFRNTAAAVCTHPFFDTIYQGRKTRRQTFQASQYPVIVEMYRPFAEMSTERLDNLATGNRDMVIPFDAVDTIGQMLDIAVKLFSGVVITNMAELIPVYQAVWLMKFIGADFEATQPGALTDWYQRIQQRRSEGYHSIFTEIRHKKVQIEKWQNWLDEIVYSGSVAFYNQTEALNQLQRVTGWLRHSGVCTSCSNPNVQLIDVKAHVFRPADMHNGMVNCKNPYVVSLPERIAV